MDIITRYIEICSFPFQHHEGDGLSLNIYYVVPTVTDKSPVGRSFERTQLPRLALAH